VTVSPSTVGWLLAITAVTFGPSSRLVQRLLPWRVPQPSRAVRIGYVASLGIIWGLQDNHLIPDRVGLLASVAVVLAYLVAPNDDDDDDRHGRRAKVRSAWRATKTHLAHGIPAPKPAGGRA
jgi:hypothetical protein